MSELYEYYVKYSEELRVAGKWVLAYAYLYDKYEDNTDKLVWVTKRGKRAVKRLEELVS